MNKRFEEYVQKYNLDNLKTKLKYEHSYRVMELSIKYAKLIGFNEYEIKLATVIGLLHDIGRFEQIKQFDTFKDNISFDHASYGVKVLFEEGLIKEFWNNQDDYEIIKFAIENHNKLEIAKTDDERALMHARLIRDTDKMDIMHIYTDLDEIEIKVTNEDVSKRVFDSFMKHQCVSAEDVKTYNDFIVLTLSYVFDINYVECLEEFKKYLKKFYEIVKSSNKFDEVYNEAIKYIDERIDNKC